METLFGIMVLLFFSMAIAVPLIIIIEIFKKEINFQIFYFVLFLRFLFVAFLWIMHFGSQSFYIQWKYDGKEYRVHIPELSF